MGFFYKASIIPKGGKIHEVSHLQAEKQGSHDRRQNPHHSFGSRGDGYIDVAIKILIAVVLGALLLAGLYACLGKQCCRP